MTTIGLRQDLKQGLRQGSKQSWIWTLVLAVAIAAPWAFYNYHTGRHSGFVVSMLSIAPLLLSHWLLSEQS